MLDYPRHFGRQDVFAIRTFFWWGNFFSITLQLSGHYKEIYKNNISGNIDLLEASGFFICINEDPWVHHFETDNYIPVKKSAAKEFAILVEQKKFIKLSAKLDLKKWDECTKTMEKYFQVLIKAAVS